MSLETANKLPTLIFVPGAWHSPLCYGRVTEILSNLPYNFKCLLVAFPSVKSAADSLSRMNFQLDVDVIRQSVQNELFNPNEVILITHSYGSIVGSDALKAFHQIRSTKWLVIAGFLLEVGESALTRLGVETHMSLCHIPLVYSF